MSIQSAAQVARWFEKNYREYLLYLNEGGSRAKYDGNLSGNWPSGEALRVSKMAGECPKFSAAQAKELVEREPLTLQALVRTQDGVRTGEIMNESLAWGCLSNPGMSFEAEYRVRPGEHYSGITGTMDGLFKFGISFAIEHKRTDQDQKKFFRPVGIAVSHMVQCIGEMILLSKEGYGDSPYGFVFSRYNCDSDPVIRVWTVAWNEQKQGWHLYDKEELQYTNAKFWPQDGSGAVFMSSDEYLKRVELHRKYMNADDPRLLEAPYGFGEDFHCCKIVKAEYYSPNGKYEGGRKPDTGYIQPRCPLFATCFKEELQNLDKLDLELRK